MIRHTANTAQNASVQALRDAGTKTIKAACSKRISTDKVVSIEESNCPGCQRQIAADKAGAERRRAAAAGHR